MPSVQDYSTAEEPQLVNWAKGGDLQSFEELVSRYRDESTRTCLRDIMRNEDLMIDLSQNAWVKAWQRPSAIPWRGQLPNLAEPDRDQPVSRRLRRRKRARMDSIEEIEEATGPVENRMEIQEVDPMERLNREELRERIDAAMAKLSDNHRTVLVLYEYEQIEYKHIAEKMSSIGTVMSRLFMPEKKMAALLGETLKRDGWHRMNENEIQLKVQALVDGELTGREAESTATTYQRRCQAAASTPKLT